MSGNPHIDILLRPWLDDDAERRVHGLDDVDPDDLRGGRKAGIFALLILIGLLVGLAVFILTASPS
jgi:hypothetical protein